MAFVDPGDLVERLVARGVQPILAHPERHAEFLRDARLVETLIARGCLIQVNAQSVVRPPSPADGRLIRGWFQRGMVHLVASDGHSPDRRPPRLAAAYETICNWIGSSGADRVCCIHGLMVCDGRPLKAAEPASSRKRRFPWLSF
jgi:protein-tyrosine phosphatase